MYIIRKGDEVMKVYLPRFVKREWDMQEVSLGNIVYSSREKCEAYIFSRGYTIVNDGYYLPEVEDDDSSSEFTIKVFTIVE